MPLHRKRKLIWLWMEWEVGMGYPGEDWWPPAEVECD